jgi:hypothetical protein
MLFTTVGESANAVKSDNVDATSLMRPNTASSTENHDCKGNGGCLMLESNTLLSSSSNYVKNPNITCRHSCEPKKCPNYLFCKRKCPEWILSCNCGLCENCSSVFGMKLTFKDHKTCSVCSKTNQLCVNYKHCEHFGCFPCFTYSFYGLAGYEFDQDAQNEPKFPYSSEIEEEYYDDTENPKWKNDKLIVAYLKAWSEWDERTETRKTEFLDKMKHLHKLDEKKDPKNQKTNSILPESAATEKDINDTIMLGQCPLCGK